MAECFSIPSREEAERFSEAYLDAQRSYYDALEDRKEELFTAVRTLRNHCLSMPPRRCDGCQLKSWCAIITKMYGPLVMPGDWPDPEEGGGEDG